MKIFFAVSPRAVKKFQAEYHKAYSIIEQLGHENVNDLAIINDPDLFYKQTADEVQDCYVELTKKLRSADIVIIEATIHSLTMGFYIKMALDLEKPTIVLYQPGSAPFFFLGIQNERLQIVEYTSETLKQVISQSIEYARDNLDVRFNLFIPSELNEYLKWAAKKFHTPRSNFVRNLLQEHKKLHLEEYKADLKK